MSRKIDPSIDAARWIEVAENDVSDVDCVLMALGPRVADKGFVINNLSAVDEIGLAEYLESLACQLRSVARRLDHLAQHGDLSDLVSSLVLANLESLDTDSVLGRDTGLPDDAMVILMIPRPLYDRLKLVEKLSTRSVEQLVLDMLEARVEDEINSHTNREHNDGSAG